MVLAHWGSVGFKFDTLRDLEDPHLFAKKIGVRYPLAVVVADDFVAQEANPLGPGRPTRTLLFGEWLRGTPLGADSSTFERGSYL